MGQKYTLLSNRANLTLNGRRSGQAARGYPTERLANLLRDPKVATMSQLKSALGTSITITVLRKLSPLGYRSSYSHGGSYYTLNSIDQYNELSLWACRDIHSSRHGTLLKPAATATSPAFIISSVVRW